MKKIFKWTLFAVATLSLVACGTTAQKTNSQQAKTEKAAKSRISKKGQRSGEKKDIEV